MVQSTSYTTVQMCQPLVVIRGKCSPELEPKVQIPVLQSFVHQVTFKFNDGKVGVAHCAIAT